MIALEPTDIMCRVLGTAEPSDRARGRALTTLMRLISRFGG